MIPVQFASDANTALHTYGHSVLQYGYDGKIRRMTMLYIRDERGYLVRCFLMPAEEVI